MTRAARDARAVRDPGLQPERTRLAWRRTTLACTVVAVLAVRLALYGGVSPLGVVAVVFVVLALAAFLGVAHARIRALSAPQPQPPVPYGPPAPQGPPAPHRPPSPAPHRPVPPLLSPRAAAAAAGCAVAIAAFGTALLF
ncbi:DUF202 domain-containing protein [Streptomyces sp. 7N604]|uniref:DUF202 domain-containing protein n=1 Tax=Streptomyces sp. 7N604 TaxID=3457415 RepID=UPI003FCFA90C